MKRLLMLFLLTLALLFLVTCTEDNPDDGKILVKCTSNTDCAKAQFCDLSDPHIDENYEEVYYCADRDRCSATNPSCEFGWQCCIVDSFCVTNAEYNDEYCNGGGSSGTECTTNSQCMRDEYCDLEAPVVVDGLTKYYCRQRLACARTNDNCAFGWQCCYKDAFCVTAAEYAPVAAYCESDTGDTADTGTDTSDTADTADDGDSGDTNPDTANSGDDGDTADTSPDTGDSAGGFFTENFDSGGSNWTTEGEWAIGTPTAGPGSAISPPNAACTVLAGNYQDGGSYILYTTTAMTLPTTVPILTFKAWVDMADGSSYSPADYMEVIAHDPTKPWAQEIGLSVEADTDGPKDLVGGTSQEKINGYLDNNWYTFTVNLNSAAGKEIQLGFRFTSDSSDNKYGICVDNIVIK